jgi:hypothetical protein
VFAVNAVESIDGPGRPFHVFERLSNVAKLESSEYMAIVKRPENTPSRYMTCPLAIAVRSGEMTAFSRAWGISSASKMGEKKAS